MGVAATAGNGFRFGATAKRNRQESGKEGQAREIHGGRMWRSLNCGGAGQRKAERHCANSSKSETLCEQVKFWRQSLTQEEFAREGAKDAKAKLYIFFAGFAPSHETPWSEASPRWNT
jgi:hypothetical protein